MGETLIWDSVGQYWFLDCPSLNFGYCCDAFSFYFYIGKTKVGVVQFVFTLLKVLSLALLIIFASRKLNRHSIYLQILTVFLVLAFIQTVFNVSPIFLAVGTDEVMQFAVNWILNGGLVVFDIWLSAFLFQADLKKKSILKAILISIIYVIANFGIQATSDFYFQHYAIGQLICSCLTWLIFLSILVLPKGNCYMFSPREAIKPMAVYYVITTSFSLVSSLLYITNKDLGCVALIGNIVRSVLYPLCMLKLFLMDAKYWQEHYTTITENWTEGSFTVDPKQKIKDVIKIKWKDLFLDSLIGQGSYSHVYKGKWKGTDVAIKELLMDSSQEKDLEELKTDLLTEAHILRSLRHPNIVLFLGLVIDPPHLAIITEFMDMGCLFKYLKKIRTKEVSDLSYNIKLRILHDVATGMAFLHSHDPPILHCDLKSLNILIDSKWNTKVSDFGLSRAKSTNVTTVSSTLAWTAPEVLCNEPYTEMADYWSFGIIAWEVTTCKIPGEGRSLARLIQDIEEGKDISPPVSLSAPTALVTVIKHCCHKNPEERFNFQRVLKIIDKENIKESDSYDLLPLK